MALTYGKQQKQHTRGKCDMGKVIAISNNKGGILKSTSVANLAALYAADGKRVLIIDADPQGNSALSFGQNPDSFTKTLLEVLTENLNPKDAIVAVYENIDLLPSNDELVFFDFEVLQKSSEYRDPFSVMDDKLSKLNKEYDIILIDSPPTLGLMQGNIFCYADEVLIPFQPETYSMRSLLKMFQSVAKFKKRHNPSLKILGVFGTLVDKRTGLHSEVMQAARKYCLSQNVKMFDTIIPKSIRFSSSTAYDKLPAVLTQKKNEIVSSYQELYLEVMDV